MLITIPAAAHGRAIADSILDLEPLFDYLHACRPDAVRMMPPLGADDQPNGPALLAVKMRLESEGIAVVPGRLEVPAGAPVTDEAWRAQWLFETRALLMALGEAGVEPLDLSWAAAPSREALLACLEGLVPEAETSGVRVAVQGPLPLAQLAEIVRAVGSPWIGLGAGVQHVAGRNGLTSVAPSLLTFDTSDGTATAGSPEVDWPAIVRALVKANFQGPLLIDGLASPIAYAKAVGYFRGLTEATQRVSRVPLIAA